MISFRSYTSRRPHSAPSTTSSCPRSPTATRLLVSPLALCTRTSPRLKTQTLRPCSHN